MRRDASYRRVVAIVAWGTILPVAPGLANEADTRLVDAPPVPPEGSVRLWASDPPPGCPFPPSESLIKIGFTGRHAEYTGADTWYPCWADDDKMYSPWTDGDVNGIRAYSGGDKATTGHATIIGDNPLDLTIVNQGTFASSPRPYEGRYPCGSLIHDGIWYYGTYCLHPAPSVPRDGVPYNWPWLGPFVGFRWSKDFGKTWNETPHTPTKPLFDEHALNGEPIKIGAPHVVDFGKALQHSPDGKAYLVAHGASDGTDRRFAYDSWITGDEIYLLRVAPALENMNDAAKYEFFAGHDADGEPIWTSDFGRIRPIATWRDNMGCVTMTYNAPLRKYLLCVTDGGNTVGFFNTCILESDRITGPWKLVSYLKHFGEQAYFVNIPSRFISADGRTLWLCYAANFSSGWGGVNFHSRPPGSRYGMCLQQTKLLGPSDPIEPPGPLDSEDNIASSARLTTSSVHRGYAACGATDGIVDGFPRDTSHEWCTQGEVDTALLRLTWDREETIDRVWLFDRPNDIDQVKGGMLILGDGTLLKTGELPDDASKGLEIRFAPRTVKWIVFLVAETKTGTANIGLSEIAVFRAKAVPSP
ncbi:MAG: hypothetical protein JXA69_05720 [Phycisphaerae bacterium]|nr:hypothetical protein [Phycisphaerae bacterium]